MFFFECRVKLIRSEFQSLKIPNVASEPGSLRVIHYKLLDGYPASLGFPVMHRVHAMAYAPNLKGKGRFVNGWFL